MYGDLSVASERDLVAASLLPVAGPEHAPRHLLRDIAAAHDILPTHGAARHCGLLAAEVTDGVPIAALPDPGRRKCVTKKYLTKKIFTFLAASSPPDRPGTLARTWRWTQCPQSRPSSPGLSGDSSEILLETSFAW